MPNWPLHLDDFASVARRKTTLSPGNGRMNNSSQSILWDRLSAQPRNCWYSLIWSQRFISAKETIAAGSSSTAARITAAVGATCVIAATARKFAGTENVTSRNGPPLPQGLGVRQPPYRFLRRNPLRSHSHTGPQKITLSPPKRGEGWGGEADCLSACFRTAYSQRSSTSFGEYHTGRVHRSPQRRHRLSAALRR